MAAIISSARIRSFSDEIKQFSSEIDTCSSDIDTIYNSLKDEAITNQAIEEAIDGLVVNMNKLKSEWSTISEEVQVDLSNLADEADKNLSTATNILKD